MGLYGSPELHPVRATDAQEVRFCPQCGRERDPGGRYCAGCGYRFGEVVAVHSAPERRRGALAAFLRGLLVGFIGLVVIVVASLVAGPGNLSPVLAVVVLLGLVGLVGGPLYYWLVNPVWIRLHGRRPSQPREPAIVWDSAIAEIGPAPPPPFARRLWEWRWLVGWVVIFVALLLLAGPASPIPSAYLALSGVGWLLVWASWARRGLGKLMWELQDAFEVYAEVGERLAEALAEPAGGQERLQQLDTIIGQRRAAEEKFDAILSRWPQDLGWLGRFLPSYRQAFDRNLAVALQSRKRSAHTYDLLAAAIAHSEVPTSPARS